MNMPLFGFGGPMASSAFGSMGQHNQQQNLAATLASLGGGNNTNMAPMGSGATAFGTNAYNQAGMQLPGLTPQGGNWFTKMFGGGNNMEMFSNLASGLSALGGMYMGHQQLGNARSALNLQREAYNTNMDNSIQSYNTRLEDRIRGRSANPNERDIQSYLDRHSLSRSRG